MKDVPGTRTVRFNLILSETFQVGDIFSSSLSGVDVGKMEVEEIFKPKILGTDHKVVILMTDDEREIAINHFKFLCKYNLI